MDCDGADDGVEEPYFCTVVEAKVVPKGGNLHREVRGGYIVLQGMLKRADHIRKTFLRLKLEATTEDGRPVDFGSPFLDCEDAL